MVEIKTLSSPKVTIPVIGIIVLIVVSSLVAVFYIRNPTVTDGIFGANPDETTSATFSVQSDGSSIDHVSQSPNSMGNQSSHLTQSTTPGNHEHAGNTSSGSSPSATPATLPVTTAAADSSTQMHAIEPVQHL